MIRNCEICSNILSSTNYFIFDLRLCELCQSKLARYFIQIYGNTKYIDYIYYEIPDFNYFIRKFYNYQHVG